MLRSAEVRGENTPERKVASTGDRIHNHQVMSPTRSPLSNTDGQWENWMVFYAISTVFQSYHGDSSHYSCLSWFSPVLGWALKCLAQGHSHEKNPEDPGWPELRTPGLQVKHFTTEPRGTLYSEKIRNTSISFFPHYFFQKSLLC